MTGRLDKPTPDGSEFGTQAVYITVIPSPVPKRAWHDYPVVKHCGHHWTDRDRRAALRAKIAKTDPEKT